MNRLLRQLLLTLVAVLIVTAALLQLTRQHVAGRLPGRGQKSRALRIV